MNEFTKFFVVKTHYVERPPLKGAKKTIPKGLLTKTKAPNIPKHRDGKIDSVFFLSCNRNLFPCRKILLRL